MNIYEVIGNGQKTAIDQIREQIQGEISQINGKFIEKKKAVQDACDAYFADLKGKQDRFDERVRITEQKIGGVVAEINKTASDLITATEQDDNEKYEKLREKLHDLEAEKASLEYQADTLRKAKPHKDESLYEAVEREFEEMCAIDNECEMKLATLRKFAAAQKKAWEEIEGNGWLPKIVMDGHLVTDTGYVKDVDRVEADFNGWDDDVLRTR